MTTTVAITGHRPDQLPPHASDLIRRVLNQLVGTFPQATWLTGGAIGVDQIAADELFRLNQRVELVLAFPAEVQSSRWSFEDRNILCDHYNRAAEVEIIRPDYHVSGYHLRNRRLVERADLLLAFWNGRPSGTGSTVNEAVRRGDLLGSGLIPCEHAGPRAGLACFPTPAAVTTEPSSAGGLAVAEDRSR